MTDVAGAVEVCPGHGSPEPYRAGGGRRVDAGPVADHIRGLIEQGDGVPQIARASGCSVTALRDILRGQRTVHRDTARLILAVQDCEGVPAGRTDRVPALGTRRRLQGLTAMGYETIRIAGECGLCRDTIVKITHGHLSFVNARTAERVAAAARRLILSPGGSKDARLRARRYGWVPLAAWDDIDDPKARPDRGRGRSRGDRAREIVEDTAELVACRLPREEIARRLGVQWEAVLAAHARRGVSLMGVVQ